MSDEEQRAFAKSMYKVLWYYANLEDQTARRRDWYEKNKETAKLRARAHYRNNKARHTECAKAWRAANIERVRERQRAAQARRGAKDRKRFQEYKRNRRLTDPGYRITEALRKRLWDALQGNAKAGRTMELVGCSTDELKSHLQSKFTDGMAWNNYGKWQIDHIVPCSAYDLSNPEHQRRCFHYSNLQPLWASDNNRKHAKVLIKQFQLL